MDKTARLWSNDSRDPRISMLFTSRFEAPPVETYRLTVTFAYEDGEAGGGETQIEAIPAPASAPHAAAPTEEHPAEATQAVAHADEPKAPATDHAPAPAAPETDHN